MGVVGNSSAELDADSPGRCGAAMSEAPGDMEPTVTQAGEDRCWMWRALELARRGAAVGEVPVGAVLVRDGQLLGSGFNRPRSAVDPSAHAEIVALREAALAVGNYRLLGATLFVSVEPCAMCAGALVHARVERLVFAALEPRAGAVSSHLQLLDQAHLNHRVIWSGGVLAEHSGALLQDFFKARRGA